jgi:hypothetical protein
MNVAADIAVEETELLIPTFSSSPSSSVEGVDVAMAFLGLILRCSTGPQYRLRFVFVAATHVMKAWHFRNGTLFH